jgi:Secreted protein acidic and rich in cysteine Ca binding region
MQGKIVTAIIALALAAPAFAQDTTNAVQSNDNSTRSQVDNQSNSTRNNQQSSNDQNVPTKNSSTKPMNAQSNVAGNDFDTLDTKHQGYLRPTDVSSNKKLSTNFKSCDKNHDGRLSREEYEGCSAGM